MKFWCPADASRAAAYLHRGVANSFLIPAPRDVISRATHILRGLGGGGFGGKSKSLQRVAAAAETLTADGQASSH